ncbi:MAG: S-adenosyl-l-methionine hydroxide adenosyltransferase family protein [Desulfococcaceae bacterium]
MSAITLLTDFGTQDEYAGVMKGVILSVYPGAVIVDISHQTDPQDIMQASYMLRASWPYFPAGTVHVIVVDPGVGGKRDILAAQYKGHFFLAPDNGILSLMAEDGDFDSLIRVENSKYFRDSVSRTFHGRDIFAPAAAHLAMGVKLENFGTRMDFSQIKKIASEKPFVSEHGEIIGKIISTDRFGNLISNISEDMLSQSGDTRKMEIHIGSCKIEGLSESYESMPVSQPLAIIGSCGLLEIALNCGHAGQYFGIEKGAQVVVNFTP